MIDLKAALQYLRTELSKVDDVIKSLERIAEYQSEMRRKKTLRDSKARHFDPDVFLWMD
jgi:hypothetical protein